MQEITVTKKQQTATYHSVEDLAEAIGLGRQATYEGLRTGKIPSIRVGKNYVIPRAAIAEWLRTAGGKLS